MPAVDLLEPEAAGGFECPRVEASAEPVEYGRIEFGVANQRPLFRGIGAELVVGGDFAGPLLARELTVTVDGFEIFDGSGCAERADEQGRQCP